MKERMFFIALFLSNVCVIYSQNSSLWKKADISSRVVETTNPPKGQLYQLNEDLFRNLVSTATSKSATGATTQVSIPSVSGNLEKYNIEEYSNFSPDLQAQYPDIRAYKGKGITDKSATLFLSISPDGIQTMVLKAGKNSEYIESYNQTPDTYMVFDSSAEEEDTQFQCSTKDIAIPKELAGNGVSLYSSGRTLRTFRLALSCTGEYSAYFDGTTPTVAKTLAAMNKTMSRVNGIFNRDLAVKLEMINKPEIIYLNATTDPYSPANVGIENDVWNTELQNKLTTVVGEANYDIGHLFGASGGGGNAGCIGCVCQDNSKGSAFTSPSNGKPEGDDFDIDYVAHEMGHQLGANHTFSYDIESTGVNIEPGSGSTIMGYAGITNYNIQAHSDDYFAFKSINQIQKNLVSKPSTCPLSKTTIANATPVVSLTKKTYTIPKGTPFYLSGSATDLDISDQLTYCWEQSDSATSANTGNNSVAYRTKSAGPMFRSFLPTTSKSRYFPAFERILAGQLSSKWESVSDISKKMKMVFTVRDNSTEVGQTASDSLSVEIGNTGPFEIKTNTWDNDNWKPNSTQMIAWNVNNTNTLAGAENVNIKLSTDGGLTFTTTLASNTPNDGEEIITVPNITAENCRYLIEPTDNIFYTINAKPISIGFNPVDVSNKYYFVSNSTSIPEAISYLTKTITVPQTELKVADINVTVKITHSSPSDLDFEIISPQGVKTRLFLNNCSGYVSPLTMNFDDAAKERLNCGYSTTQTVMPEDLLSVYNGTDPSGNWTFKIRDKYTTALGTVDIAMLDIVSKTYETLSVPKRELKEFILSPNPNDGHFNVKFKSEGQNEVYMFANDMLGRKIFEKTFDKALSFDQDIDLENAKSGVYLLTIIDGDRQETKKILVKSKF